MGHSRRRQRLILVTKAVILYTKDTARTYDPGIKKSAAHPTELRGQVRM